MGFQRRLRIERQRLKVTSEVENYFNCQTLLVLVWTISEMLWNR